MVAECAFHWSWYPTDLDSTSASACYPSIADLGALRKLLDVVIGHSFRKASPRQSCTGMYEFSPAWRRGLDGLNQHDVDSMDSGMAGVGVEGLGYLGGVA